MGFLSFAKKNDMKKRDSTLESDLPPLPDLDSKNDKMHAKELGLPPLPEGPSNTFDLPKETENVPNIIPPLKGESSTPNPSLPNIEGSISKQGEMDEAPEFPSLDDYMDKEEVEEDIPPLEIKQEMSTKPISPSPVSQRREIRGLTFITLGQYKEIMGTVDETEELINTSVGTLLRIIDVKLPLDDNYSQFKELLDDLERKISYVGEHFLENRM